MQKNKELNILKNQLEQKEDQLNAAKQEIEQQKRKNADLNY